MPDLARQQVDVVRVASGAPPAHGAALTDVQNARTDRYDGAAGDTLRVIAADGSVHPMRISGRAATSRAARK